MTTGVKASPMKRREAGRAEPIGVADHERERAEHLGAIAEHACLHLDAAGDARQRVAVDRVTDAVEQRLARGARARRRR